MKKYNIIHLSILGKEKIINSYYNEDLAYKKLQQLMADNPICIFYIKEEL